MFLLKNSPQTNVNSFEGAYIPITVTSKLTHIAHDSNEVNIILCIPFSNYYGILHN